MKSRKSSGEWRCILTEQKDRGLADAEWAKAQGVSVSGLRYWRRRLNRVDNEASRELVEIPVSRMCGELRITLPNGIVLTAGASWPLDHLVRTADLLRKL